MRTAEEVLARMDEVKDRDTQGIERSRLLDALPWEHAKEFLTDPETVGEEEWVKEFLYADDDALKRSMEVQLEFFIGKANMRSLGSTDRARASVRGFVFLLPDSPERTAILDATVEDWDRYYGKRQFVAAARLIGFDWEKHDDGKWVFEPGSEPVTAGEALAG